MCLQLYNWREVCVERVELKPNRRRVRTTFVAARCKPDSHNSDKECPHNTLCVITDMAWLRLGGAHLGTQKKWW